MWALCSSCSLDVLFRESEHLVRSPERVWKMCTEPKRKPVRDGPRGSYGSEHDVACYAPQRRHIFVGSRVIGMCLGGRSKLCFCHSPSAEK